jgi:hypothetical protein
MPTNLKETNINENLWLIINDLFFVARWNNLANSALKNKDKINTQQSKKRTKSHNQQQLRPYEES